MEPLLVIAIGGLPKAVNRGQPPWPSASVRNCTVDTMRAIDLETRVLAAVERVRNGEKIESDLIECKRGWPSENKARQLAGSLNRAAGDTVIYVIGIDEKDGSIHDTANIDILDWWNQIVGQFDQVPAEMVRHIDVPLSATESVVGIAFSSDRAPYLVKTGSAKPSLEIPMREGTGTRTARRDEVMRMLAPSLRVPTVTLLESTIHARYRSAILDENSVVKQRRRESVDVFGAASFFVEHDGQDLVTLPTHSMTGTAEIGDLSFMLRVTPNYYSNQEVATKEYIHRRPEAVVISGPGVVPLQIGVKGLEPSHRKLLEVTEFITVRLRLGILHAIRPLIIEMQLNPDLRQRRHGEDLNQWSLARAQDG